MNEIHYLQEELWTLFLKQWTTFTAIYSLPSTHTCVFGDHIVHILLGEPINRIDVFFKDSSYRDLFQLYLEHAFTVTVCKDNSSVVLLSPNFQVSGPAVSINLNIVCNKVILPSRIIDTLQLGPNGDIGLFQEHHNGHKLTQIMSTIFQKRCKMNVLSMDVFLTVAQTTMTYDQYWRHVFQEYIPYLHSLGWCIENVKNYPTCCGYTYVLDRTKDGILCTCTECMNKNIIFVDFMN